MPSAGISGAGAPWSRGPNRGPAGIAAHGTRRARRLSQSPLGIDLGRVNRRILDLAGSLPPEELRSPDAIHLATARRLGSDRVEIITYDDRQATAARTVGLKVSAPT